NDSLRRDYAGIITVAEESTAWPGVTRSTASGGLGFNFKWNMGWMHDTLDYMSQDPVFRRYHHQKLTFGLWYAWSENFILPLSHDEVVHMKGSLLRKMAGDSWQRMATLRSLFAWMWAHPGKKLLFMGGELAQPQEWSHDSALHWELLEEPAHAGVRALVSDLCARYREIPSLFELDDRPEGFRWIDAGNADQNGIAFARFDGHGRPGERSPGSGFCAPHAPAIPIQIEESARAMDTHAARGRLIAERERLEGVRQAADRLGAGAREAAERELSSADQHPAELATETIERELDWTVVRHAEAELAEIDAALAR